MFVRLLALFIVVPLVELYLLLQIGARIGLLTTVAVMLAMTSVIVMRIKAPDLERPFRIPLYPIPPLVSLGIGGWLIVSATIEPSGCRAIR